MRKSDAPPDLEHDYGHGKYENLSAAVEALLATIRMNRLTSCLALTASWCAGNNRSRQKHPLNWESFRAVYRSQFEEV